MKTPSIILSLAALALAAPIIPPLAKRGNLPTPIAISTAKSYLSSLTVAAESNSPPYDRDAFTHWITLPGGCTTREYVLRRDGGSECGSDSGEWYSDYDGETWTDASDVGIDHVVPLREAWVSGAREWSDQRREEFANEFVFFTLNGLVWGAGFADGKVVRFAPSSCP